jgi:hypothetical protein
MKTAEPMRLPALSRRRFCLLGSLALAGCAIDPDRHEFPEITYAHLPAFELDVAQIEIHNDYSSGDADDIAGAFPEPPARVAAQWAKDRLRAVGQRGQATYSVVSARSTRTPLPRSEGVQAVLTTDQSDRYDLNVKVTLEVGNPLLQRTGSVTAEAGRSQTVAENMTLNQREIVLFNLLDQTMRDLNSQLEQLIPQYLGAFLR